MISFVTSLLACAFITSVEFLCISWEPSLITALVIPLLQDVGQNSYLGKVADFFFPTFKDKVFLQNIQFSLLSAYLLNHVFELEVYWKGSWKTNADWGGTCFSLQPIQFSSNIYQAPTMYQECKDE